jgi:nucleotide-binding universal stress UspA family protein
MMVQTILVGLDWGETVNAVAETAVELAVALDASVKALYIEDVELIRATERAALATLPASGNIPLNVPSFADLEAEFQSEERVLAKRFLRLAADTRIRGSFLIAQGEVPEILTHESRAHDLLVMGKYSEHHPEPTGRRPLGRHVESILRKAWCPVVLVPPQARLGSRYLVVYDGTPNSHRAMATTVRLARATQALVEVLVVAQPSRAEDLLDEAQAYLESHKVKGVGRHRSGDAADEILREAEAWGADLLCMGALGTFGRKEALDPRVLFEVLESLDRPALLCGTLDED